jgi:hypothetical protein
VLRTLQGDRVSRQGNVLHTLRTVCGTCYVNDATTVWTGKLLEQNKTCRDAVRLRSLYKEVRHNKLDVDAYGTLADEPKLR